MSSFNSLSQINITQNDVRGLSTELESYSLQSLSSACLNELADLRTQKLLEQIVVGLQICTFHPKTK